MLEKPRPPGGREDRASLSEGAGYRRRFGPELGLQTFIVLHTAAKLDFEMRRCRYMSGASERVSRNSHLQQPRPSSTPVRGQGKEALDDENLPDEKFIRCPRGGAIE
ncbi:hypothetical protein MRX96_044029 [Rhipicephalus microplus]